MGLRAAAIPYAVPRPSLTVGLTVTLGGATVLTPLITPPTPPPKREVNHAKPTLALDG